MIVPLRTLKRLSNHQLLQAVAIYEPSCIDMTRKIRDIRQSLKQEKCASIQDRNALTFSLLE